MADYLGAIPILSMQLIQESIMRDRLSSNDNRKTEATRRLDYYSGDQLPLLSQVLNKQFSHPERLKLQLQFSNITKRIIDDVSTIYKKEPGRHLIDADDRAVDDKNADNYDKMLAESSIDIVLKLANRYTNLLNTVGVMAVWRNERVELDILTPDILNVVQDPKDPTRASAVIIEQSFADTVALDAPQNPYGANKLYIVWTSTDHMVFDSQGKPLPALANEQGVNPYGVIPIAWFRDAHPCGWFWNEGTQDLMNAQDSINVKLTELNQLIKMQSFSIPVIIGEAPEGAVSVDPSNFITIPLAQKIDQGQPDFKFVSPDPKIQDLLEVIRDEVARIADAWSLNPAAFKLQGSAQSGLSLKLQNVRLLERRENDIALYRQYEKNLFRVMRSVWNAHVTPAMAISEDLDISVNFSEMDFPEDPAAEDARWITHVSNNIKSKAEWLMSVDPDIKTKDEAEKRLAENSKINKDTSFANIPTEGMADALGVDMSRDDEEDDAE